MRKTRIAQQKPASTFDLVVLALEVGGRWSQEAKQFVVQLARARARAVPAALRRSSELAFARRWTSILACASQRAFAMSLLELPLTSVSSFDGQAPALSDVLADVRFVEATAPSRLC